jgi:hypothetical protein
VPLRRRRSGRSVGRRKDKRTETALAQDLVLDEAGEREVVEEVGEERPHCRACILAQALVVKAIHLSP